MSQHQTKKEKSLLWLIFPVAAGLTLMFALINQTLNMGDKTPVAPEKRIEFSAASPEKKMMHQESAHKEMESHSTEPADSTDTLEMPADTAHAHH